MQDLCHWNKFTEHGSQNNIKKGARGLAYMATPKAVQDFLHPQYEEEGNMTKESSSRFATYPWQVFPPESSKKPTHKSFGSPMMQDGFTDHAITELWGDTCPNAHRTLNFYSQPKASMPSELLEEDHLKP